MIVYELNRETGEPSLGLADQHISRCATNLRTCSTLERRRGHRKAANMANGSHNCLHNPELSRGSFNVLPLLSFEMPNKTRDVKENLLRLTMWQFADTLHAKHGTILGPCSRLR